MRKKLFLIVCFFALVGWHSTGVTCFPPRWSRSMPESISRRSHIWKAAVMNTVGQVLYDTDAESDRFVLDMSQYESGMYLVRVSTDSGTIVKRINVVR